MEVLTLLKFGEALTCFFNWILNLRLEFMIADQEFKHTNRTQVFFVCLLVFVCTAPLSQTSPGISFLLLFPQANQGPNAETELLVVFLRFHPFSIYKSILKSFVGTKEKESIILLFLDRTMRNCFCSPDNSLFISWIHLQKFKHVTCNKNA